MGLKRTYRPIRDVRNRVAGARHVPPPLMHHRTRPPDPEEVRRRAEAADALWQNLVRR
jgi:hypothetical protein